MVTHVVSEWEGSNFEELLDMSLLELGLLGTLIVPIPIIQVHNVRLLTHGIGLSAGSRGGSAGGRSEGLFLRNFRLKGPGSIGPRRHLLSLTPVALPIPMYLKIIK
jgi:hypothetical protein